MIWLNPGKLGKMRAGRSTKPTYRLIQTYVLMFLSFSTNSDVLICSVTYGGYDIISFVNIDLCFTCSSIRIKQQLYVHTTYATYYG